MSRISKDTVNQPSRSNQEFVTVDGVRKRNIAYDKNKKQSPSLNRLRDKLRNMGPDSEKKDRRIANKKRFSDGPELEYDQDAAVAYIGGENDMANRGLHVVICGDEENFTDSSEFSASVVDENTGNIVFNYGELSDSDNVQDVVDMYREEEVAKTYAGIGLLLNENGNVNEYVDGVTTDYGDLRITDGWDRNYDDYHWYAEKPSIHSIDDEVAFTCDVTGRKPYGDGAITGDTIELLRSKGFYDTDNWEPIIDDQFKDSQGNRKEYHKGFKMNSTLAAAVGAIDENCRNYSA